MAFTTIPTAASTVRRRPFPSCSSAAGYQTAVFGKWHLVTDPTGFDEWHILPGQGVYYNPPMIHNGQRVEHQGYTTDIITELSLDWLKKRDKSKPFLLMCQHKAPHREWLPAIRHLGHDHDRRYPEPPTLFDDYSGRGKAEHDQDMTIAKTMTAIDLKLTPPKGLTAEQRQAWDAYYEPRNAAFRAARLKGNDLVSWKYQRYMHDYLGCVKAVDESVGRLLKFLDDEGLAGDTIVVYSADQGFYLGEHGWFDKRWIFEESLRAPLLVRWPGVVKPGSTNCEPRLQYRLRRDVSRCGRLAGPGRDAGPKPRSRFERPDAARLAIELLLPVFRVPGPSPRSSPLRGGDGPLQARPLRWARPRCVGAFRPGKRPARAA